MDTKSRQELTNLKDRLEALGQDIDLFGDELLFFLHEPTADDEESEEALEDIVSSLREIVTKMEALLGQDKEH